MNNPKIDAPNTIPIIGSVSVGQWFVTAQLSGPCEGDKTHHVLFVGQPGGIAGCQVCRRVYVLRSVVSDAGGRMEFKFDLGLMTADKPAS